MQQGDQVAFTIRAKGSNPLVVTICWNDPAALANANPALVHDIDVRLTSNGTTYFPWTLDPNNPEDPAERNQSNNRDNIEQVFVDQPLAGQEFSVVIDHQGTIAPQIVSIFISGNQTSGVEFQVLEIEPGQSNDLVTWVGSVGQTYRVQRSTNLSSWTDITGDIVALSDLNFLSCACL